MIYLSPASAEINIKLNAERRYSLFFKGWGTAKKNGPARALLSMTRSKQEFPFSSNQSS